MKMCLCIYMWGVCMQRVHEEKSQGAKKKSKTRGTHDSPPAGPHSQKPPAVAGAGASPSSASAPAPPASADTASPAPTTIAPIREPRQRNARRRSLAPAIPTRRTVPYPRRPLLHPLRAWRRLRVPAPGVCVHELAPRTGDVRAPCTPHRESRVAAAAKTKMGEIVGALAQAAMLEAGGAEGVVPACIRVCRHGLGGHHLEGTICGGAPTHRNLALLAASRASPTFSSHPLRADTFVSRRGSYDDSYEEYDAVRAFLFCRECACESAAPSVYSPPPHWLLRSSRPLPLLGLLLARLPLIVVVPGSVPRIDLHPSQSPDPPSSHPEAGSRSSTASVLAPAPPLAFSSLRPLRQSARRRITITMSRVVRERGKVMQGRGMCVWVESAAAVAHVAPSSIVTRAREGPSHRPPPTRARRAEGRRRGTDSSPSPSPKEAEAAVLPPPLPNGPAREERQKAPKRGGSRVDAPPKGAKALMRKNSSSRTKAPTRCTTPTHPKGRK
ncbi:hypothetical protein B0H16DRAFT_1894494 [Mycena metata]|uniref:Uncharacterized protein n=1 Tax=Mycena metata TaxID=1033252 RepID=A0AAD7MQ90_9AGAR|nr:hypothetical protein B0H16DRAFT_1894494 [Mycena metata]